LSRVVDLMAQSGVAMMIASTLRPSTCRANSDEVGERGFSPSVEWATFDPSTMTTLQAGRAMVVPAARMLWPAWTIARSACLSRFARGTGGLLRRIRLNE